MTRRYGTCKGDDAFPQTYDTRGIDCDYKRYRDWRAR